MASSPTFDPYHRWLGIAAKDQPPHHYRLLGVDLFESDADVLAMAADQRMSHLRTFQNGPTSAHSQRLLNEVSTARVCLLNPERKAAYDIQLRAKLEPTPLVTLVNPVSVEPVSPRPVRVVPTAVPLARVTPRAEPRPLDVLESIVGSETASSDLRSDRKSAGRKPASRGKASPLTNAVTYGVVVLVLGVVALAGIFWSQANKPQPQLADASPKASIPVAQAEQVPSTMESGKKPPREAASTTASGQASDENQPMTETLARIDSGKKPKSEPATNPGTAAPKKEPGDGVVILPLSSQATGPGQEMRSQPAIARSEPPEVAPGTVNGVEFGGHRIEFVGVLSGHADPVNCVALSRDGQLALSGGRDNSVHLWNVPKLQHSFNLASHTQEIDCVAMSADGNLGLSGGGHGRKGDCELRVWDLTTGTVKERLSGHRHKVRAVMVLPSGKEAISVSFDCTTRLWNLVDAMEVKQFETSQPSNPAESQVWSLAMSHDSRCILAGMRDNTARLYEIESGRELHVLQGEGRSCFGAAAISSDDQRALLASNGFSGMESALYYWDLASGQRLRHTPWTRGQIASVVFLPDSKYALIACRFNEIVLWDVENGVLVQQIPGHTGPVTSLAISADGRTFISGSADRTIRVWSLK